MKRWITLFAVAGRVPNLGASGPGVLAADVRWNMSSDASHPIPRPEVCRNLRRELSIDIDKLAHVEHQQAQPRKSIPLQEIERRLSLRRGRRSPECQPPPNVHRLFRRLSTLLRD